MAAGDVTIFGPYNEDNISDIKTDLEAASIASTDALHVTQTVNGSFYIIYIEAA